MVKEKESRRVADGPEDAEVAADEAEGGDGKGDAAAGGDGDAAGDGAASGDNFQDEIVDQADPQFTMASRGDDCINWTDVKSMVEEGFMDQEGMTEEERTE